MRSISLGTLLAHIGVTTEHTTKIDYLELTMKRPIVYRVANAIVRFFSRPSLFSRQYSL